MFLLLSRCLNIRNNQLSKFKCHLCLFVAQSEDQSNFEFFFLNLGKARRERFRKSRNSFDRILLCILLEN